MARVAKSANNLQVFRGSRPRQDVFAQNSGSGCCDAAGTNNYDKLADRTRFDNQLAHSNPTGANDKYFFARNFNGDFDDIVNHINAIGVGATISVLAVPTYAFVTGVGVHIGAVETGLTFNLITRNGLVLPYSGDGGVGEVIQVAAADDPNSPCGVIRTQSAGSFEGFGALGANRFIDIFGRYGQGSFSLEADEIILQVATMPAGGEIVGDAELIVSVSYDVIHRAEA